MCFQAKTTDITVSCEVLRTVSKVIMSPLIRFLFLTNKSLLLKPRALPPKAMLRMRVASPLWWWWRRCPPWKRWGWAWAGWGSGGGCRWWATSPPPCPQRRPGCRGRPQLPGIFQAFVQSFEKKENVVVVRSYLFVAHSTPPPPLANTCICTVPSGEAI